MERSCVVRGKVDVVTQKNWDDHGSFDRHSVKGTDLERDLLLHKGIQAK